MMKYFRMTYKIIGFLGLIVIYLVVSCLWRILYRDMKTRRQHYIKTVSWTTRMCLRMMSFKISIINPPPMDKAALLVGNHLGMFDILVLASNYPCLFVTSVEMRETPGLGLLTEMGGSLYVERRNRSNIQNELVEIREALQQGFRVVLYPEGTSTNGERVLPFKKTLMTAAAGTGVPILPMVINYRKVNGEPVSHKWRDYVCWYGDQTFLAAFLRVVSVKSIEVDIEFFDEVIVKSEEHRREVAALVQKLIVSKYVKIPLPPGEVSPYAHIPEA
jgi:1-acyl-sn-glycerol-3-phosphate acyltransferase